jgi:predicted Zn-dependent peptidase
MTEHLTRLDNGFRIVVDPVPHVGIVTAGVWVGAGARDEPEALNGLSHFLEHLLFKGTATRTAFEIAAEIENRGGSIDAYTDYETTAYYVQTGARHWPVAIALLADVLTASVFPEDEVERDRSVVLQEIDQYTDEPEAVLGDALHATLYPDQPLGRPILGTAAHVAGFTRQHLLDHLASRYRPERMVLVVSGRVDAAEVAALGATLFGTLAGGPGPVSPPARPVGGHRAISRDIEQAHYALAFDGLNASHPELPALRHVANILGGGLTSRLFQEIREQRGLAYDVHADLETFADTGFIVFEAATTPGQLEEMAAILARELERALAGFTAEELARSKEQLRFLLGSAQDSTFGRAQRLARDTLVRDGIRSLEEIEAEIDGVTLDGLTRVARRVLSGPPTSCVVGPPPARQRRPLRRRG